MSDLSQELRAKCSDEMHRLFHAICLANSEDATARLRRIVQADIDAEMHKHKLLARLLASDGIARELKGSAGG